MNLPEDGTPEDRFERSWKKWAAMGPRRSPSEAASRVGAMIRERRQRRRFRWEFAAAAAAVVMTIALAFQWIPFTSPPTPSPPPETDLKTPVLGEGEILMWIDQATPLYMTFQPPGEAYAKGGKQ